MNKKYLAAGIIGLLVLSTTMVFALSNVSETEASDEMQQMHDQMTKNIKDPELKAQMDEMHKDCMNGNKAQDHHGNSSMGSHMGGNHM